MMERALKERIIGAVVLVVFVVLVVPIFLDGPPENGAIISERVLLPGQEDQVTRTVVLERGRSEPIPAAVAVGVTPETETKDDVMVPPELTKPELKPEPEPESEPEQTTVQQSVRAEPESVQQTETPEVAALPSGMWAVQLGSFSNRENAEILAADLRKQGYAVFLTQLQRGSGVLHRVRIGPQKDRASAEAMAARLKKVNRNGQVVPHP